MKLQELLTEILTSGEIKNKKGFAVNIKGLPDETIYGEDLEQFKDRILQTEEFADCEELIIMKHPVASDANGKPFHPLVHKVGSEDKYTFKGKCYLLSLALTPEMFDPLKLHEPVLDGACITPTIYDPKTFEPKKKIVLEFSPEFAQDQYIYGLGSPSMIVDAEKNGETIIRKQLHETLDRVLDNPENYKVKGEKGILVRGFFEETINNNSTQKVDLVGIETNTQRYTTIYFFEKDEKNSKENEVSLKLSNIPIPIELRDKFVEEIGVDPMKITREQVEDFLARNEEPKKKLEVPVHFVEKNKNGVRVIQGINIPLELHGKYIKELGSKSTNVTREEIEEFLKRNEEEKTNS